MNIYQAALKLRQDYAHTGIELEACPAIDINIYLIHHDALHTYTNRPPSEEYELIVLAAEMLLGGVDYSHLNIDANELSQALSLIPNNVIEELVSFYTYHFSN